MTDDDLEEYTTDIHMMHAQQKELYALYAEAHRGKNPCKCLVCVRLRMKAWDDQNNLVAGDFGLSGDE